jgi:hypothetical protein
MGRGRGLARASLLVLLNQLKPEGIGGGPGEVVVRTGRGTGLAPSCGVAWPKQQEAQATAAHGATRQANNTTLMGLPSVERDSDASGI